ncbi:aggregation factor core protein MAFp3, isoform C [Pseudophaeobacter sp.]|uniref:aggregation factor core protein MAFp3, isoform C n=1 Tax=Pseudophaeobacter sp. TaxID=1971739 RepID=UPI0040596235
MIKALALFAASAILSTPALAQVTVSFIEGAPKDRFVIENTGRCGLAATILTIDLSTAASGLVYDVTDSGPGVEVFQPFELVSGQGVVQQHSKITDGDTAVILELSSLAPGETVGFTIDIDDTSGRTETMVAGHEISGAEVTVKTLGQDYLEAMSAKAQAVLPVSGCAA